jgi:uncharacterized protein
MLNLPLYTLFETVRDRFNRQLGLSDYLLLLDAMQQGIGIANYENLKDVCAMLWLKNKPQQDAFKAYFDGLMRDELEGFLKEKNASNTPIVDDLKKVEELTDFDKIDNSTDKKALPNFEKDPSVYSPKMDSKAVENSNTHGESGQDWVTVQWDMGKMGLGEGNTADGNGRNEGIKSGASERWKPKGKYILTDNYHPFSERELTQNWRRLRRKQPAGTSRDIDVEATIKQIAQQGVFDKPIGQRRLVNDYRLIVLVDWKGSMLAFHALSDLIVETLKAALPKTEVWYFRNHPQTYFYGRADWTEAIKTEDWLFQLKQNPANLLIISDGGAARGTYVTERLQSWWRFFKEVKPIVPHIVWLNPMPKIRWAGTTAGYVEKMVGMKDVGEDVKMIKELVRSLKK